MGETLNQIPCPVECEPGAGASVVPNKGGTGGYTATCKRCGAQTFLKTPKAAAAVQRKMGGSSGGGEKKRPPPAEHDDGDFLKKL